MREHIHLQKRSIFLLSIPPQYTIKNVGQVGGKLSQVGMILFAYSCLATLCCLITLLHYTTKSTLKELNSNTLSAYAFRIHVYLGLVRKKMKATSALHKIYEGAIAPHMENTKQDSTKLKAFTFFRREGGF